MRFSITSVALLAGAVAAVPQYGIQPISQISDGQIQAPPATPPAGAPSGAPTPGVTSVVASLVSVSLPVPEGTSLAVPEASHSGAPVPGVSPSAPGASAPVASAPAGSAPGVPGKLYLHSLPLTTPC